MAKRDPEDSARIKAIEEKLLANPEMAKLIDELGTSTSDANDLVRPIRWRWRSQTASRLTFNF
nr:hypothetical protein [Corynebacterium gallinarum]